MTEIPVNANVYCTDGPCGKSTHLIVNPVAGKVTHLVVEDKKLPDNVTRLVPVEKVSETSHDLIRLNCAREEVGRMEPFITTRYLDQSEADYPDPYWGGEPHVFMQPYVTYETQPPMAVEEEHLPAGELDLHRGMHVEATDGEVGKVDELIVQPDSWTITHIVFRHGHLWGKKEVTVPVSDIDRALGDRVYLRIDKATVESRPSISVRRLFS